MKITAVIMAGGRGERFWPKSRVNCPKQFLSLTPDGTTMIQHTIRRLLPMIVPEDIYIVTGERYRALVQEQLPDIPKENIIVEPMAKNTAPCIALAAAVISKKYDDAVMVVLPADHLIKNSEMFLEVLNNAANIAEESESLVTIGITPTYPETGYGYINFGRKVDNDRLSGAYKVERFVEKPDIKTAKEYLASGKYLWNSGMFVWKISAIMENFQKLLPDIFEGIIRMRDAVGTNLFDDIVISCFKEFPSVSIDYGIMEKAENIVTIPGNFGWDDVGSWLALERINPTNDLGNVVSGDVITINTQNSIIIGDKRLIAAVGVENIVIVDAGDAILICNKKNTQDVKSVLENLKICNRYDLI